MNQREQLVRNIFDRIAPRYDLLNRIISLHLDTRWRRKLIDALGLQDRNSLVLDLGTGTGDLALAAAQKLGTEGLVVGLDFSSEMIEVAKNKAAASPYGNKIQYLLGSALMVPFIEKRFDAIMTAFVLRNVADQTLFFREAFRVLKPGGAIASLDMFPPHAGPFALLYSLYFYRLVPWIGATLAHNHHAYRYLSDSVRKFSRPEAIGRVMQEAGFPEANIKHFLFGAVCLHTAKKPLA